MKVNFESLLFWFRLEGSELEQIFAELKFELKLKFIPLTKFVLSFIIFLISMFGLFFLCFEVVKFVSFLMVFGLQRS